MTMEDKTTREDVSPQDLSLRARPRSIPRINRRVLVGVVGGLFCASCDERRRRQERDNNAACAVHEWNSR